MQMKTKQRNFGFNLVKNNIGFPNNFIKTAKYNYIDFLPKNLFI